MLGQYHGKTVAAQVKDDIEPVIHPNAHLDAQYCLVAHTVMTQLSMKKGLKV